jgi:hypothetical protein
MINTFFVRPLTAAYAYSALYLFLVYGLMQEWALMAAAGIKALGWAYLVEMTNKGDNKQWRKSKKNLRKKKRKY